ncbi:MAG: uncharacterized protein PWQ57_1605 [Desulfovibrionales bacterium]|jgi:predicted DNA-binding protein with PD1-like motif|nr:uncharacterized protein [Desulfovibrionales bacterium]
MKYKRYGSKLLLRLDPGDEVIASVTEVCEKENIHLGAVTGLGAVDSARIGCFDPYGKQHHPTMVEEPCEITSLLGNVSRMDGKIYLHLHATLAGMSNKVVGGHLNMARVSAMAEIWIDGVDGLVDREFSEKVGLNVLKF